MARRSSRSRSRDKEKKTETQNKGMLNLVDAVESPAPERKAAARALDQRIAYEESTQPPRVIATHFLLLAQNVSLGVPIIDIDSLAECVT